MQHGKTLYRSTKNRALAGVCGGLAEHFDTDPVLVRLIFAVLAFAGGSGILLYLVLWIVVPEENGAGAAASQASHSSAYHGAARPVDNLDAHIRDLRNRMQRSHNHANGFLGFVVIIVGAFLLLNDYYPRVSFQQILGILIIVFGIALITRRHNGQR